MAVAGSVLQVTAVDLAIVVTVNNAGASTDTGGGAVAGQIVSVHPAVVVTVEGVLGTGTVGVAASDVMHVHLAVVVTVKWVVGASTVVVRNGLVVTMAGMLVGVGCGLVGKTLSNRHASSTADVLGHTLELIVALLTAAESSSLGLELIHSHGRQSGSLMVSSLVVVNLVDRDGGVHYAGLDGLLLNNGLDGLVDMLEGVNNE